MPESHEPETGRAELGGPAAERPILRVTGLSVQYPGRWPQKAFTAAQGISFSIPERSTLGLVGESGSGKTTVALAVMRLLPIQSGAIFLRDIELSALSGRALRKLRPRFQMIFQDPYSSLDPRRRAQDIIAMPMRLNGAGKKEALKAARELLWAVGLPESSLYLFPHEFSGGQRQRLMLARALSLNPELLVADEPVSALDVAIQAQILNLLADLKEKWGLSGLFISHDLGVIQRVASQVGVMYRGRLLELSHSRELFQSPSHPYTLALLSAALRPGQMKDILAGAFGLRDTDDGLWKNQEDRFWKNQGCPFQKGCRYFEMPCQRETASLRAIAPGQASACRLAPQIKDHARYLIEAIGQEEARFRAMAGNLAA